MENASTQPLELDFKHLFQVLPGLYIILSPALRVLAVSDPYLQATHSNRDTLVGRYLFDSFPENPDAEEALTFGKTFVAECRWKAAIDGSYR